MHGGWRTPLVGYGEDVRPGDTARRRALPAVSPRLGAAVGRAGRPCRQLRSFRSHGTGTHQRAVAVRRGRVPRRFRRARASAVATLLARPRADRIRRPGMDAALAAPRGIVRARGGSGDHLYRDARAALEALAVRARPSGQPAAVDRRHGFGNDAHRRRRDADARPAAAVAPAGHAAATLSADVDHARHVPRAARGRARAREARQPRAAGRDRPEQSEDDRIRARAAQHPCRRSRLSPTPCSTGSTASRSSTRWRRRSSARTRWTDSCSTLAAASASTTPAPSSCCCAPRGFRRAS